MKRPKHIDNSVLLNGKKLKRGYGEHEEYYKLNSNCWVFIITIYRGNPEIKEIKKHKIIVNDCKHYY